MVTRHEIISLYGRIEIVGSVPEKDGIHVVWAHVQIRRRDGFSVISTIVCVTMMGFDGSRVVVNVKAHDGKQVTNFIVASWSS